MLALVSIFLGSLGEDGEELREVNGAVTINIVLIDSILNLSISWVLSMVSQSSSELLSGDEAITVLIENIKLLLMSF
jgi:hypothetical protein